MATLSEYFENEAREQLAELERALAAEPAQEPDALLRAVRALRGSAQMAREDAVFRVASALETAARSLVARSVEWSDDLAEHARQTLDDLRSLVERSDDSERGREERVDRALERWKAAGIEPAFRSTATVRVDSMLEGSGEFREFAAREVGAIAEALETGIQHLSVDPMDREPLRVILRRQRALLGSARLDEIPVVAEILRAVEDLTRVVAKLDVSVKQDWLDVYRVAREGLRAAAEPLHNNEDPQPSHALSRLRHMREELLERYGTGEAVSAANESGGLVQVEALQEAPGPTEAPAPAEMAAEGAAGDTTEADGGAVPIDTLLYDGDGALARAMELRDVLERVTTHDPLARDAVAELFDLIQLARG